MNEARFFKFWSEDQRPNTLDSKLSTNGKVVVYNPLLEEYVDCLHFTLSIANDLGVHEYKYIETEPQDLNKLVLGITNLATIIPMSREPHHVKSLLNNIIAFGYQLGFDENTVIEAYHEKNKENYERQENGY